ncbi:MAG TPA: hypothetical protein PLQ95_07030 [Thiobacillus sp.]|nr:hypothetical protein [Thiobacillus sp.]
MSKVEITITTPAQALKDAASVWRRIEAGGENIVPIISFGSPSELFAATTDTWNCCATSPAARRAASTNSPRRWGATTKTSTPT